jgi:hypothetical protein
MKTILFAFLFISLAHATTMTVKPHLVSFAPTNDAIVSRAFLGIRCIREASLWESFLPREARVIGCTSFMVNGKSFPKSHTEEIIELEKIGPNQFALNGEVISFSTSKKGHACLRLLTILESGKYVNPVDEWSLLGYCSVDKLPFPIDADIFNNHRVKTMEEFLATFTAPIVINTK